ncbi:MAG: VanZ family protein [bacterium]|nr:VanZ family protein [bacterium]
MVLDLSGRSFIYAYLIILLFAYGWYSVHKNIKYRYWLLAIFMFYILYVIKLTFLPMYINLDGTFSELASLGNENNVYLQLMPFKSIRGLWNGAYWFVQIAGNIVLLLPFPMFIEVFHYDKNIKCRKLILIGVFSSLIIEITQFIFNSIVKYPNRVTDIDDLILNSIGIVIGACIIKNLKNKEWFDRIVRILILKDKKSFIN